MSEQFHSAFSGAYNSNNLAHANIVLLRELGCLLVNKRDDFVFLLNESGIPASSSMSDKELIDLFFNNVGENKRLALGASLFINMNNKKTGFDGEEVLSDEMVKAGYHAMSSEFSEFAGLGQAISSAANFGKTVAENQRAKKYGMTDALQAKVKAKNEMQVHAAKERQNEQKRKLEKEKNKKVIVIAVVSVVAVALIVTAIVIYKKKQKS